MHRGSPLSLGRVDRGVALTLSLLACLAGCGRMTPHARTLEVIGVMLAPGDYERLDYVQGEDCVPRYAIFFRLSSPNVVLAAQDAIRKAPGANFFANRHVSMDERFTVPLLYHQVCVVVEGRAIRLRTAEEARP